MTDRMMLHCPFCGHELTPVIHPAESGHADEYTCLSCGLMWQLKAIGFGADAPDDVIARFFPELKGGAPT